MNNIADFDLFMAQTDCAQRVRQIWEDVLRYRGDITFETNFFEIGGDSLATMMMLFQLGEVYRVEISPSVFIEQPTFGNTCRLIYAELREHRVTAPAQQAPESASKIEIYGNNQA